MTPDQAIERLNQLTESSDQEIAHGDADRILCSVLRSQGLSAVADAYEAARNRVGFWYA